MTGEEPARDEVGQNSSIAISAHVSRLILILHSLGLTESVFVA